MSIDLRGEILTTMIPTNATSRTGRPSTGRTSATSPVHEDSWELYGKASNWRFIPDAEMCRTAGFEAGWSDARIEAAVQYGLQRGHILPNADDDE